MKTTVQILHEIRAHRPLSRAMLYNHFRALAIRPAAARQRPQRYPDDTALRILTHLGFTTGRGHLVTLQQLRKERRHA